jgi:hypothetical protein
VRPAGMSCTLPLAKEYLSVSVPKRISCSICGLGCQLFGGCSPELGWSLRPAVLPSVRSVVPPGAAASARRLLDAPACIELHASAVISGMSCAKVLATAPFRTHNSFVAQFLLVPVWSVPHILLPASILQSGMVCVGQANLVCFLRFFPRHISMQQPLMRSEMFRRKPGEVFVV